MNYCTRPSTVCSREKASPSVSFQDPLILDEDFASVELDVKSEGLQTEMLESGDGHFWQTSFSDNNDSESTIEFSTATKSLLLGREEEVEIPAEEENRALPSEEGSSCSPLVNATQRSYDGEESFTRQSMPLSASNRRSHGQRLAPIVSPVISSASSLPRFFPSSFDENSESGSFARSPQNMRQLPSLETTSPPLERPNSRRPVVRQEKSQMPSNTGSDNASMATESEKEAKRVRKTSKIKSLRVHVNKRNEKSSSIERRSVIPDVGLLRECLQEAERELRIEAIEAFARGDIAAEQIVDRHSKGVNATVPNSIDHSDTPVCDNTNLHNGAVFGTGEISSAVQDIPKTLPPAVEALPSYSKFTSRAKQYKEGSREAARFVRGALGTVHDDPAGKTSNPDARMFARLSYNVDRGVKYFDSGSDERSFTENEASCTTSQEGGDIRRSPAYSGRSTVESISPTTHTFQIEMDVKRQPNVDIQVRQSVACIKVSASFTY